MLSVQTRVYRVRVVRAFLRAGIQLKNIDSVRDLLKESDFSLSSSQHLRDLIPFIQSEEQKQIQKSYTERRTL